MSTGRVAYTATSRRSTGTSLLGEWEIGGFPQIVGYILGDALRTRVIVFSVYVGFPYLGRETTISPGCFCFSGI